MRNLVIFACIFLPLMAAILYLFYRKFPAAPVVKPEPIPEPPSSPRRAELERLRAEAEKKQLELTDAKQIEEYKARVSELNKQINEIDSRGASSQP